MIEADDVDLGKLPFKPAGPGDAGPLITWPTGHYPWARKRTPESRYLPPTGHRQKQTDYALAIHRGGALDFRDWQTGPSR